MNLNYETARFHFLEWVKTESLRKHGFAVEKSMRAAAHRYAGGAMDEEKFAITGLVHDGDYERWPTEHPAVMVNWLKERSADDIAQAVACHYSRWGRKAVTPLDKCLLACDEPTGFVMANALVRSEGITTLEAKSVIKKLKDKSFAAKVDREEVALGATLLGVSLVDHFTMIIEALRPFAAELGIAGRAEAAPVNAPAVESGTTRRCCGCNADTCPYRQAQTVQPTA
jgi:predicted hydrolase (HD superfamily)